MAIVKMSTKGQLNGLCKIKKKKCLRKGGKDITVTLQVYSTILYCTLNQHVLLLLLMLLVPTISISWWFLGRDRKTPETCQAHTHTASALRM